MGRLGQLQKVKGVASRKTLGTTIVSRNYILNPCACAGRKAINMYVLEFLYRLKATLHKRRHSMYCRMGKPKGHKDYLCKRLVLDFAIPYSPLKQDIYY